MKSNWLCNVHNSRGFAVKEELYFSRLKLKFHRWILWRMIFQTFCCFPTLNFSQMCRVLSTYSRLTLFYCPFNPRGFLFFFAFLSKSCNFFDLFNLSFYLILWCCYLLSFFLHTLSVCSNLNFLACLSFFAYLWIYFSYYVSFFSFLYFFINIVCHWIWVRGT